MAPGPQHLVHLDASALFPLPADGRMRSFEVKNISFENLTQTDLFARGWHRSGYLFDIEGVVTLAGSVIEASKPAALANSAMVSRMDAAGAAPPGG